MSNRFTGKNVVKKVKFMGEDIDINKLTVKQVLSIQGVAKELKADDEEGNLNLVIEVIRSGAPELKDLDREEFLEFSMDELSKLSNLIMSHSGLASK